MMQKIQKIKKLTSSLKKAIKNKDVVLIAQIIDDNDDFIMSFKVTKEEDILPLKEFYMTHTKAREVVKEVKDILGVALSGVSSKKKKMSTYIDVSLGS
jgi:hypothetical protein